MSYRHELYARGSGRNIVLSHEQTRPSGLIIPQEIGELVFRHSDRTYQYHPDIAIPTPAETAAVTASRDTNEEPNLPLEVVYSDSTQKLVNAVMTTAKRLIQKEGLTNVAVADRDVDPRHEETFDRVRSSIKHYLANGEDPREMPGQYL